MKKRLTATLFALILSLRAFADGIPDLGDAATADISPQLERSVGEAIVREIRFNDPDNLDDPEIEDYLTRLGNRLVAASQAPSMNFRFFALKDKSINAASMLGGVLVFNTGLITAAQSESELAAVMAHEISHTQQRHQARMIAQQQNLGYMVLASLLVAVLAARSSGDAAGAAAATGQAAAASAQLAYSRDFEREADRIGLHVLNAAGFDVRGMVSFFERLDRQTRLFDSNAFAYLRTHPLTTERISDIANRVQQMPYRQVVDSLDFTLVKAKVEELDNLPSETLSRLAGPPPERPQAAAAYWYSRTRAHLRNKDVKAAQQDYAELRKLKLQSSMIDLLGVDVRRAAGDNAGALALFDEARKRFPQSRALLYGQLDTLIAANRAADASRLAAEYSRYDPSDDRLFSFLAQASALQGKRLAQHRAQAEVYYLQGSLPAAIEQLNLGLRSGDGDFYEKSQAEARLAQFRAQRQQQLKDKEGKR
ncbi:MAG: M48 family metalloprotease [Betaproteobacteria bacterium]|nr:M48 family metalloprotease [Betaproteobacteria bacterium]